MSVDTNIAERGIEIPSIETIYGRNPSGAQYVTHYALGETLYLTGCVATRDGMPYMTGVLGKDLTVEQGYDAARQAAICYLSIIRYALEGNLERVVRILRLVGYVNSAPGFSDQPRVINGAGDLFVDVFGDAGVPTRAAIGCQGLASNHSVELIAIVQYDGGPVSAPFERRAIET